MEKTFKYILTVAVSAFVGMQMWAQSSDNGVVLDKHVTDNENGTYNITLESYVTGETVMKPMDIVLVLDNSNSMSYLVGKNTNGNPSRRNSVQEGVKSFIETLGSSIDHRIAILEFYNGGRRIDQYIDKFDLNNRTKTYGSSNVTGETSPWMSMKDNYSNITSIVTNTNTFLKAHSNSETGTPAADGLKRANELLSMNFIKNDGRKKIVLFFTDGCCGTGDLWGKTEGNHSGSTEYYGKDIPIPNRKYAVKVVTEANNLKKDCGATIYCIGTFGPFDSTDYPNQQQDTYFYLRHISSEFNSEIEVDGYVPATTPGTVCTSDQLPSDDDRYARGDNLARAGYKYTDNFHTVDTGDWSTTYTSLENGGYMMDASSNKQQLVDAFTKLATDISASAKLDETSTVVLDALTNMFQLPAGTDAKDIHLFTCDATGNGTTPSWKTTGTGGEIHYKDSENKDLGTTPVADARAEYWEPWAPWTSDTDMLNYIKINPSSPVAEVASGSDVLEVTGFDFAGNCVAKKNGNYTGKKLIIQFEIETDPANTGGVSLKTNDPASGIYYKPEGSTEYEAYEKYEEPVVYLPYIKIVKKGLEEHESAAFRITKVTASDGATESSDATKFSATVILSQDKTDKSAVEAIVKLIYTGYYKVEELDWSWTYAGGSAQVQELSTVDQDTFDENGYLVYTFENTKDTSTKGNAAEWFVINQMGE